MTVLKAIVLKTSIVLAMAGALIAACVDPAAAMPVSTQFAAGSSSEAYGPIPARWRGRAQVFEDTLMARAIAGGVVADPGPLYGRYYGYRGYPGHYPCCYYPQVFDRFYYAYYYIHRAGAPNPTWWNYPNHWEGW